MTPARLFEEGMIWLMVLGALILTAATLTMAFT